MGLWPRLIDTGELSRHGYCGSALLKTARLQGPTVSGPVLIGFGSALLAILFGAIFYFWRRERYLRERRAECLGLIEDCEKLIAEFADRLPEILRSKNLTDQDRSLFLRWNNVSKEIHASLFRARGRKIRRAGQANRGVFESPSI